MKKLLFVSIFSILSIVAHSQTGVIKGRVIDGNLDGIIGAEIMDNRTNHKVYADAKGMFNIDADAGDTLTFYFVGSAKENRVVKNKVSHINVILINKETNDLGAIWTKRQWAKANKQIERKYKKLEEMAEQTGKWDY